MDPDAFRRELARLDDAGEDVLDFVVAEVTRLSADLARLTTALEWHRCLDVRSSIKTWSVCGCGLNAAPKPPGAGPGP